MIELKDNYQDDVLDSEKNQLRKYNMIQNDDGTVSFVDATVYSQNGDNFGAKDVNDIVARIGEVSKAENIAYDGDKSVQSAIDECVRTLGYTVTSKNYLPNNSVSTDIFTVNNDKTVTVNGKGTIEPWTNIYFVGNYVNNDYKEIKGLEDGVDYIYSCCSSGASIDSYQGHLFVVDENNNVSTLRDNGEGVTFTHHKGNKYCASAGVKYNYQATNILLKPMISKEGGEYEPYVEDVKTYMDNHSLNKVVRIVSTSIVESTNEQIVTIPNYQDYNALFIKIFSDANNGSALYIPKCLFEYAYPFSIYSTNNSELVNQSGYAMRVQGEYNDGQIKVSFAGFTVWTSCYVTVDGIK